MKVAYLSTLIIIFLYNFKCQAVEKFGLLTVTHSRNNNFTIISNYLQNYAQNSCYKDLIEQINIVWNEGNDPSNFEFYKNRQKWKIPVLFHQTAYNSMNHRYRLNNESKSQTLFSLDDDILIDCKALQITFNQYLSYKKHKWISIFSRQVRGFAFDRSYTNYGDFLYQGQPKSVYFAIAQAGVAFIPKKYLEIYYYQIPQIKALRDTVVEMNNCDDIFFHAIIQHFFPFLSPIYFSPQQKLGQYINTDPQIGQSRVSNVIFIRSKCFSQLSSILGYIPLRFFDKNSNKLNENWNYQQIDQIAKSQMIGFNQILIEPPQKLIKSINNSIPLTKQKTFSTVNNNIQKKLQTQNQEKTKSAIILDKKFQKKDLDDPRPEKFSTVEFVDKFNNYFEVVFGFLLIVILGLLFWISKLYKKYNSQINIRRHQRNLSQNEMFQ